LCCGALASRLVTIVDRRIGSSPLGWPGPAVRGTARTPPSRRPCAPMCFGRDGGVSAHAGRPGRPLPDRPVPRRPATTSLHGPHDLPLREQRIRRPYALRDSSSGISRRTPPCGAVALGRMAIVARQVQRGSLEGTRIDEGGRSAHSGGGREVRGMPVVTGQVGVHEPVAAGAVGRGRCLSFPRRRGQRFGSAQRPAGDAAGAVGDGGQTVLDAAPGRTGPPGPGYESEWVTVRVCGRFGATARTGEGRRGERGGGRFGRRALQRQESASEAEGSAGRAAPPTGRCGGDRQTRARRADVTGGRIQSLPARDVQGRRRGAPWGVGRGEHVFGTVGRMADGTCVLQGILQRRVSCWCRVLIGVLTTILAASDIGVPAATLHRALWPEARCNWPQCGDNAPRGVATLWSSGAATVASTAPTSAGATASSPARTRSRAWS
jgi:hypothetical protein